MLVGWVSFLCVVGGAAAFSFGAIVFFADPNQTSATVSAAAVRDPTTAPPLHPVHCDCCTVRSDAVL